VVEQEIGFGTAKACIPSEKPDSTSSAKIGQIMLAEINVVVGRYYSNRGTAPSGSMVDPLTRVTSGSRAPNYRRCKADKFSFN
jgi:hypothetical protein